MAMSFLDAGYDCLFGDLMFALGLPFSVRSAQGLKRLARLIMPIAGRLPFEWLYPTGEKQEARTPKWGKAFAWAKVVAGDVHFIKRFAPDRLDGKIIVTNTTTPEDVAFFRGRRRLAPRDIHPRSRGTLVRHQRHGGGAGGSCW